MTYTTFHEKDEAHAAQLVHELWRIDGPGNAAWNWRKTMQTLRSHHLADALDDKRAKQLIRRNVRDAAAILEARGTIITSDQVGLAVDTLYRTCERMYAAERA